MICECYHVSRNGFPLCFNKPRRDLLSTMLQLVFCLPAELDFRQARGKSLGRSNSKKQLFIIGICDAISFYFFLFVAGANASLYTRTSLISGLLL